MVPGLADASIALDIGTLFVVAICVSWLLGLFLLFSYLQERIAALAWWGLAYVIGGFSGALWRFGELLPQPLSMASTMLLFVAVGMIWTASRVFYGRQVRWWTMLAGAGLWPLAWAFPEFALSAASRMVVSALIVAFYTFLTANEMRSERRKSLIRRWPAALAPMLHGAIFLFPVMLATWSSAENLNSGGGWLAVFAAEVLLYVVGAAFIVLIMAKDRTAQIYKNAAATDPLTGLLNRRGFYDAAGVSFAEARRAKVPVCVMAFDLDRFKTINDRCGHAAGDAVLQLFSTAMRNSMRAADVVGRLGGEEFIAVMPGTLGEGGKVAERVRRAFAAARFVRNGEEIATTVSVGVACGAPSAPLELLIASADEALYRAKANGRDRVELADEAVPGTTAVAAASLASRRGSALAGDLRKPA